MYKCTQKHKYILIVNLRRCNISRFISWVWEVVACACVYMWVEQVGRRGLLGIFFTGKMYVTNRPAMLTTVRIYCVVAKSI